MELQGLEYNDNIIIIIIILKVKFNIVLLKAEAVLKCYTAIWCM